MQVEDIPIDDLLDDPLYAEFQSVLSRFNQDKSQAKEEAQPEIFYDDDNDDIPDEEQEEQSRLSKKARKAASKLTIAELKQLVRKPELVEWTDIDASDPLLLVRIKSQRNVVPVPSHWALKREYLSSKRGIEKTHFNLPKFIADTGIAEMRDAVLEKQAEATLKQKQRERVQGKLGKLDIDYQKLYEAFFRHQTKPPLTRYGEVYYEGKEYETNLRHLRPGELSDELREALNMPPGAPPPWLINQQRFGPPPSYPGLKIPGLNAPPPTGASWGFHPGGYGKPPVDEYTNRPLFGGDIFGVSNADDEEAPTGAPVEKALWGELQEREEEEEEDEEDDEDEDEEDGDEAMEEEDVSGGLETPSGMASAIPTEIGIESMGGDFELRKNARTSQPEDNGAPRSAYQVIPEQNIRAQGFFGGERAYDLRAAQPNLPVLGQESRGGKRKVGDMDVSVDVDALERDDRLSKDEIQRQFEAQRQAQAEGQWKGRVDQEDLSQMIAEESNKRLKQDKERNERRRGGGDSKSSSSRR
jgi:splicing factor 3B subunit 2